MVGGTSGAVLALLLSSIGVTATPEEEVASTVRAFYAAVNARDSEAVAKLITDPFLFQPDAFDEPQGREEFLASLSDQTPVPTFTLAEFAPQVTGGAAVALIPVDISGGAPPGVGAIRAVVLLVRTEVGWQVMSLTHLFTLDPEGDVAKGVEQAVGAANLDPIRFLGEVSQGLGGREPGAWLSRFHPKGTIAGPWGPHGAMVVTLASELGEVTPSQPIARLALPESPNPLLETGVGGVLAGTDRSCRAEDGSIHLCRAIAAAGWMEDAGPQHVKWCLFAGILAPQ